MSILWKKRHGPRHRDIPPDQVANSTYHEGCSHGQKLDLRAFAYGTRRVPYSKSGVLQISPCLATILPIRPLSDRCKAPHTPSLQMSYSSFDETTLSLYFICDLPRNTVRLNPTGLAFSLSRLCHMSALGTTDK